MTQLSQRQVDALKAEAARLGVDAAALLRAAMSLADDAGEGNASGAGPPAAPKIFQYQLPFITVKELRAYLNLPDRIRGDEMLCGEFLAEHGGALAGPAPKADAVPPE